jgi:hypothetical protein
MISAAQAARTSEARLHPTFHRRSARTYLGTRCPPLAAAFVVLLLVASSAHAQQRRPLTRLEYAAKFVCSLKGADTRGAVLPGAYATAINIHNPSPDTVVFEKKFATALPNDEPGRVTPYSRSILGPDYAVEIDCQEIFRRTRSRGFVKGFAVIEVDTPLDVVAVYTAGRDTTAMMTMDVERVPSRRSIARCADLVVDSILRPQWDNANHRSKIDAAIRNIGSSPAPMSLARIVDPTTLQPTGAPYNAIATVPSLQPGDHVTVTFYLPYWVYNPNVTLVVTADYKQQISECREDNNVGTFNGVG